MRNLPLASLRAFEAAARHESFVRAAAELNLQPAGISQHVKAMENWLRISLFLRHSRGVTLTAAGKEFGAAVTHALAHIEVAARQLRPEANSRPVSVACIPSMAVRWLIPQLSRLRAAYPDIKINIVYALDAKTPEAAGADLLICHGIRPSAGATKLLNAETRPTCSAEFLARHGPFHKPSDLLACDILHDETTDAWARWLSAVGIRSAPKAGPVFADFNFMIGSLISGQGVGLCPTALITDELVAGVLVSLFEQASDTDKAYWLIEAKGLSREAKTLRDWLLTTRQGTDGSITPLPASE
ncbi:LysR substrate-binding domain-containing protein [Rhizobium mesosinicum]|uniref:LysR family transcriptional regulator n=1 Tax=Rhizobium mesosinicum TaxID=335017 RepID=A0ABS7GMI7_9HYPH|nr:LysR substrate-binding domain-containing protein [Rhizobium mesosinicum]MBW9051170.1 LysR family transcriptional regulator [Rhizobium mesosinicum]